MGRVVLRRPRNQERYFDPRGRNPIRKPIVRDVLLGLFKTQSLHALRATQKLYV
jgi:hypothetical protein